MTKLSIGQAWEEAKAALQRHRRLVVPIALGLVLLPATLASMIQPPALDAAKPEGGPWMWVVLVLALVMLLGQLAIVLLVNGWRGSVGEAIARALRRLPILLGAALLIAAPMFILAAIVLAVATVAGGDSGQFSFANLNGPGRLALLLILAAMIYVSVRLSTLSVVAVERDEGPLATLKRAFAMTQGHFWRLLGFMMLQFGVFLLLALAVGAVVGSLAVLLLGKPEPWSVTLLIEALAGGLVQTGFVLVYTAMLARITAQLDGRKR